MFKKEKKKKITCEFLKDVLSRIVKIDVFLLINPNTEALKKKQKNSL